MKINSKKILEWTLGITIGIPFIALLITLGVSWFSLLSLCWTAMFLYRQSKTLGKKCQIAWQAFKDWLQQKPKAKPKKMMPQKRSVLIKPIKRKLIRPPIAKDITKSFDSPAELQTYLEEQGKEDAKNTIHYGKDLKTVLSFNLTPEIEAELSGCLLQQKLPCLIQIKTGEEAPQNHPQLLNIYLRNKRLYREKALQEAGYFGALKIDETESASRENISRAKINLATGHHEEHSGGLAFQRHMQHARQKQQQTEEQHATQSMLDARREQLAKRVIHKPHFQPTPKDTWHLINKENIKTYIVQSTNFSLQTIQPEVFWDELVGVNAGLVTSTYPERAITHVDKSAMQHIVSHFSEFRYGLVLDNLPHGFHLYKNDHQLILYYDKNTPDLEQDERETLKIAIPPVHVIPKGTVDALLRDTESANHSRMQAAYNIVMNDHTNDHHLEEDTKARQKAFIELITMSAPILPAEEILTKSADEWQAELDSLGLATHMHYQALTAALCASSRQSVIAFLNQLIILKAKDKTRYQHFKNTFLDTTDDFSDYMTPHAFYTIKELGNLSKVENIWWESLTHDHCISTRKANFNDLFQAFQYFLSRINEEHCTLPYRAPQKTKHMKIALDRLLTILDHAADKKEQCAEFGELDLSQEGAYYASREDFKLVSPEMRCSPDELIAKGNSEKWCFAMTDHMQDKIHQITCNRSEGLRGLLRKIKESSLSLEQQKVIRLIIIKQFGCGGYISAGGKFKYQCLGNDNKKLGRMLLVFRKTLPDPFATFLVATPTIADWPYFALHAPELWAIIIKNDKKFNQFIDALENDAAYNQLDPAIREIMDHYNPFDPALDKIFYSALDKTSYSYSRFYSSNNKEYYRNQAHKTHESYDTLPIHLKKMLDESIHGCITYVEDGRADIYPPIDLDESNYADRLLIARILNCSSFTITLQPEAPTQEEIQRAEREKRAVFSYIEQDVKQSEDQYNPFNIPLENFINRTYGENKKHFFRQMGLKEMALPLYFYRSLVNIISNHYYLQERVKFKNVHAGRTFVPTLANPSSDQDFVCRSFNNDSINPHANAVLHLLGLTSTTERQLKIGDNTEQITQLLEIIARHPEQSEESTDNEKILRSAQDDRRQMQDDKQRINSPYHQDYLIQWHQSMGRMPQSLQPSLKDLKTLITILDHFPININNATPEATPTISRSLQMQELVDNITQTGEVAYNILEHTLDRSINRKNNPLPAFDYRSFFEKIKTFRHPAPARHPERSEGSPCWQNEILRYAQDDEQVQDNKQTNNAIYLLSLIADLDAISADQMLAITKELEHLSEVNIELYASLIKAIRSIQPERSVKLPTYQMVLDTLEKIKGNAQQHFTNQLETDDAISDFLQKEWPGTYIKHHTAENLVLNLVKQFENSVPAVTEAELSQIPSDVPLTEEIRHLANNWNDLLKKIKTTEPSEQALQEIGVELRELELNLGKLVENPFVGIILTAYSPDPATISDAPFSFASIKRFGETKKLSPIIQPVLVKSVQELFSKKLLELGIAETHPLTLAFVDSLEKRFPANQTADTLLSEYGKVINELNHFINDLVSIHNESEKYFTSLTLLFEKHWHLLPLTVHFSFISLLNQQSAPPITQTISVVYETITNLTSPIIDQDFKKTISALNRFIPYTIQLSPHAFQSVMRILIKHTLTKNTPCPLDEILTLQALKIDELSDAADLSKLYHLFLQKISVAKDDTMESLQESIQKTVELLKKSLDPSSVNNANGQPVFIKTKLISILFSLLNYYDEKPLEKSHSEGYLASLNALLSSLHYNLFLLAVY